MKLKNTHTHVLYSSILWNSTTCYWNLTFLSFHLVSNHSRRTIPSKIIWIFSEIKIQPNGTALSIYIYPNLTTAFPQLNHANAVEHCWIQISKANDRWWEFYIIKLRWSKDWKCSSGGCFLRFLSLSFCVFYYDIRQREILSPQLIRSNRFELSTT